jgi:hypothetical protein
MFEQRRFGFGGVVVYALNQGVRDSVERSDAVNFAIDWLVGSGSPGQLPPELESRTDAYVYVTRRLRDMWNRREAAEVIGDLEAYLVGAFPDEPPIMEAGGPITLYTMALLQAFAAEMIADHFAPFGPGRREHVIDEAARGLVSLGVRYRESL